MNNRKSYNSVLFLTTLGVYLGLVLVGATPVLGHAATTRNFELQDEIEVKDDLDKKPDSDAAIEQFALTLEQIYLVAAEISADHPEKVHVGQYSFNFFITVNPRGGSRFYSPAIFNSGPRTHSGRYTQPLHRIYDAFLSRSEKPDEKFRIDFELTSSDVALRATISQSSPEIAESVARPYIEALSKWKEREISVLKSLIYSATEVSVENNQLIIVTRLARGSIDPLIAKSAK